MISQLIKCLCAHDVNVKALAVVFFFLKKLVLKARYGTL